jgi:signal transduction histidine kinase
VTAGDWSAVAPGPSAPSASALRAAFALYFADEALSSVRHDILNRLTAIGAIAYELRNLEAPGAEAGSGARERIADLNRQIGLMSTTISRRLGPTRDRAARTPLSLAIGAAIAASAHPQAVQGGPLPEAEVRGSTTEVAVMVLALLDNAMESRPAGPGEAVGVELRCWVEEGVAHVEIGDQGPGLTDEASAQAFERFFTTKPGHAGLGLCMARTLAGRLGGELQLQPAGGADAGATGSCATLRLPLAGAPDGEDEVE